MNIFTNDDYRRIQAWLKANAIKDSDFAISETTVPDEDILVITRNMSTVPTNYKIKIKDLLNSSLDKEVIGEITANIVKVNNSLTVDASKVILNNEKGTTLQDVLNYFEENKLNRHTDDTFDGNLTIKKNITIEGNIKSNDGTTTVEADLEATGEITDGDGNILSDVNDTAKGWKIEYQDPQQDEPTVRAKYILKDYRGVPKGNVIKVYKDSAITNVYLGTTEDTCNPDTGEITKKPVHDNNEALSIVYRLDTGKYMIVNVPLGVFTREAEFDKYRGLGVTENGQVFVKLASDVESSNYLHFNDMGEVSADGIENRILQDLGTIINSVANDGTMWGQYKKEEGTKDSPINEASRWGQYKQAEADRNGLLNIVSSKVNQLEQEQIQGGVYDVSTHNDEAVFESLQDLLSSSNLDTLIPTSVRHGGMSIRFIQGTEQSSDNKYVQYRLMLSTFTAAQFTTPANWQGVDDVPIAGSDNLVKSNGVFGLNEHIFDNVGNFRVEFSSTQEKYRIKLDGSSSPTDTESTFRINNVPSYYKKIIVLSDCANNSLCIAFYNSNSLDTSTFISGVAGQNQPILSEHKLGYYEVDIPQGTVMIAITCTNLNGQVPKAVLGANGSYPKEVAVSKNDIKNILGDGAEYVLSQNSATSLAKEIRETIDVVKYTELDNVFGIGYLKGEIGETIAIDNSVTSKRYAILPIEDNTIVKYNKHFSSLNNAIYWLDDNNVILAKEPLLNPTESSSDFMNCSVPNAKKVGFWMENGATDCYIIKSNRFDYAGEWVNGGVKNTGELTTQNNQKRIKVNVQGCKYIMAKVRNYGKGEDHLILISFFDKNNDLISNKYPVDSWSATHDVFVATEVPVNAAYAWVMTRAEYVDNAKVYIDNYSTFIENEINSYKDNGELSNKKVYNYNNTTFIAGGPVGNVGETISYDTSSASYYHVEFDCKGFTCIEWIGRTTSSYSYFVDENNVILKKLPQRAGNRIDVFDRATKFIVYVHKDYRSVFNATLYNFNILPIESSIGFNGLVENGEFKTQVLTTSDGVAYNRQYNHFISFKIFTEGLEAIFAKIRNYSGTAISIFSFWDKNSNYLSDYITMNGANTEEYVGAIIPTNSHYCIVTSRQYDVKLFADKKPVAEKLINEKGYITLSPTYNYSGNAIKLQRNNFTVGRIGQAVIPQYITIDNVNLGGQGMAIFGDVMFKFYNKGYYNVYRIREGLHLEYVNQFHLGSYGDDQHVNNCQFSTIMSDTGCPYLYVGSAASPLITVEKVSPSANGVLVQTIDISGISGGYNVGIDENYLWLFGGSQTTLKVLKFNIPPLSESEVTLTENEALDSFEYQHAYNADGQIQGGKVYNDKLYWVFGANRSYHPGEWKRALYVFDLKNKVRESFVDLSNVLEHELEDFEIYGNIGLISINQMANTEESYNGNGLYFIKFD